MAAPHAELTFLENVRPRGIARAAALIGVALAGLMMACDTPTPAPSQSSEPSTVSIRTAFAREPIDVIPMEVDVDEPLSQLGEQLFVSPIVSSDGKVTCASCHALDHGLADRGPFSEIPGRPATATNSTSLFNARYFYKIKWNGEFDSLDTHLDALIQTPKIMASSWAEIASRVAADPSWASRFRTIFSDGVSGDNVKKALLEYERSLVTPNAPFDRWLLGDADAISREAKSGYELFKDYGCISCHQGVSVGANMFARFGVMGTQCPARAATDEKDADLGRFNVTHRAEDRHVFRVPSLRNVAATAPYFHDGSAETLDAAVRMMAECQLGREMGTGEVHAIVAFLDSLTGEYRGKSL
jgi:cytochrome c peroxidase